MFSLTISACVYFLRIFGQTFVWRLVFFCCCSCWKYVTFSVENVKPSKRSLYFGASSRLHDNEVNKELITTEKHEYLILTTHTIGGIRIEFVWMSKNQFGYSEKYQNISTYCMIYTVWASKRVVYMIHHHFYHWKPLSNNEIKRFLYLSSVWMLFPLSHPLEATVNRVNWLLHALNWTRRMLKMVTKYLSHITKWMLWMQTNRKRNTFIRKNGAVENSSTTWRDTSNGMPILHSIYAKWKFKEIDTTATILAPSFPS